MKKLIGKTLSSYGDGNSYDGDLLVLKFTDGSILYFRHIQDCCESVYLEDITGELSDLIGHEIKKAYHASSDADLEYDVGEWNFYTIQTMNGDVTLRFYGSSNGYYSISVDLDWGNDG